MVKPVTKYEAADGQLFDSEKAAKEHEVAVIAINELKGFLVDRGIDGQDARQLATVILNNSIWITRFMNDVHARLYPPEPQK